MQTTPRPSQRRRDGMTIVEVIVALMLVAIGLLGIAGSTTLALQTTISATRRREAMHRAQSRASSVQAGGCSARREGSAENPTLQMAERWSVEAAANGFAVITDSVTWSSSSGQQSLTLRTAFVC